jgi:hypothetical protein
LTPAKIIGIVPLRNEAWCAGLTIRGLLLYCDMVIALDHASTDATPQILASIAVEHPGRLIVIDEADPTWEEMRHRNRLLECARKHNATHIVTIDADELVTGNLLPGMRNTITGTPPNHILQLPWIGVKNSRWKYLTPKRNEEPYASSAFRDHPAYHWIAREGYDFHHRHPMGRQQMPFKPVGWGAGGLLHLQFLSGRRLRAKQYLYQLTERLRWPDREPVETVRRRYSYTVYGQHEPTAEPQAVQQIPEAWWGWYEAAGWLQYLDKDAEPWQLAACEAIRSKNPGIENGLDDFGLFSEPFYRRAV